ncbi:glycosyltransferase family 39 protein [Kocuria sp. CPCC 205268]|uniref:ArnT family glycosyltransferase n=1 Tax=Kocuria oxytropis TaxID=3058913 RepID=UPI0034D678DE
MDSTPTTPGTTLRRAASPRTTPARPHPAPALPDPAPERPDPAAAPIAPAPEWPGPALALPAPPPAGRRRGLLGPAWSHRLTIAALGLAAVLLGTWNLTGASEYVDDEGTYAAQAFSVLEGDLAPYTYQYDHPPLGWIQMGLLAWLPKLLVLGDGTYVGATRFAIVPFFVATVLLTYLIGTRLGLRRPLSALAGTLVLLSPLFLTAGRQVFLDNVGLPWLLLAFYLALNSRKALWHHIGAGIFFALAVLSKETMAIFGPSLLAALLNQRAWSNRVFSVVGFLVVGGLVLAFYPLMALLNWELFRSPGHVSLQDAVIHQFVTRTGSGSLWTEGSARAELLQGWLYYDTFLILAGVVAALVAATRRTTAWLPIGLACFAVPVLSPDGYLPAMYIVGAVPLLALSVGVALDRVVDRLARVRPVRELRTGARMRTGATVALAATVVLLALPHWSSSYRTLLAQEEANTDWSSTLRWATENIPAEDTVLVPYALWQDLSEARQDGPWETVAVEKADLDPQFLTEHPDGWRDVEWVVMGPSTDRTADELELATVRQSLENSETVQRFGEWSVHRVEP